MATIKVKTLLVVAAALLAMVGPFTVDTYLPAFPSIEESFGVSTSMLSKTVGGYLLVFGLSTLFWGPITDKFGRKPVINISMLIYIVASIGCALSQAFETFVLMRSLQGVAVSGALVSSRAMIREGHNLKSAQRAMSQVTVMFSLGPIIAPILGGFLADLFGWRGIFWFLAALGTALMGLMLYVKETLPQEKRQSIHPKAVMKNYLMASTNKSFMTRVFCISLAFSGFFLYIVGSPIVIYDFLNLDGSYFSYLFSVLLVGVVSGAYLSASKMIHFSLTKTVSIGIAVMMAASITNLALHSVFNASLITVAIPLGIYSTGLAIMSPAISIFIIDCFQKNKGFATSLKSFFQLSFAAMISIFILPLLAGDLMHFAYLQAFFIFSAGTVWKLVACKNMIEKEINI